MCDRIRTCARVTVSVLLLTSVSLAFGAAAPNHQADVVETSKGPLKITPLYHGSVMLEFDGKIIHVDPWGQADYTGIPKADLIVITHTHADHMDAALLKTLRKESHDSGGAARGHRYVEWHCGRYRRHQQRREEDVSRDGDRSRADVQPEAGIGTGQAVSPKGHRQRLYPDLRRHARLFFRRHGMRPGDEGAEKYLASRSWR